MRQVFDLNEYRPGPVLRQIWANFAEREEAGDRMAPIIRRRAADAPHPVGEAADAPHPVGDTADAPRRRSRRAPGQARAPGQRCSHEGQPGGAQTPSPLTRGGGAQRVPGRRAPGPAGWSPRAPGRPQTARKC